MIIRQRQVLSLIDLSIWYTHLLFLHIISLCLDNLMVGSLLSILQEAG